MDIFCVEREREREMFLVMITVVENPTEIFS